MKITIDYVMDGKPDRHWLPISLDRHGNLFEQMHGHLETYRTYTEKESALFDSISAEHRQQYQKLFAPFLTEHINERSQTILQYFQRHCNIAVLEHQLFEQAQALPETEQRAFGDITRKTISNLRFAANYAQPNERTEHQMKPHSRPERQEQKPETG